jgi:hypothetical protein
LHRRPQCGPLPGFASQENFTLQLSGVKRWRFRCADVRHPLTAFTPHFKARIETPNAYPPISSVPPPRCRRVGAAAAKSP